MIVLDTHAWIWWVNDSGELANAVRDRIDLERDIRVSAISFLENATAVSLNRLILRPSPDAWLTMAQQVEHVRIEPLTAELCLESIRLPGQFHRDPADRLIVALARSLDAELVTADGKILGYGEVRTIPAQ